MAVPCSDTKTQVTVN